MKDTILLIALLAVMLIGCTSPEPQQLQPIATLPPSDIVDLNIVTGQLVFVPAYSEVLYGTGANDKSDLAVTLAIHNTDVENQIIIQSVRYYDTDGNLVREFVQSPVSLDPMATTGFFVPSGDGDGGWGANFMVEWVAESPVYEPVIEAVMISSRWTDGITYVSPGRVVSQQSP
jgi:hypothetical protein